jgi:late competence protein required for DNA uptake (superfamily II DNA/RNA helicase)
MFKIEKKLKNRYHNKHFLKFRYLLICKSDKKLTSEDLKKQIYIYIYIYTQNESG